MRTALYGVVLFMLLILPPVRHAMESVMIVHMLVQIPLLIVSGWLMAGYFQVKVERFFNKWNGNGAAGIILVVMITIYWMVPRTLDEALVSGHIELFKFLSLPFLTGVVLRDSWRKINPVIKSFIMFNYISMFGLLAWIYIDAPVRVCNSYLETDQTILGWGFLVITVGLILYILQNVFTDQSGSAF
ncbi:hypothetical protein SAMN05216238_106187 [Lentibacillus persicus]|uniref:Uncharacterized protein n=1 Tax=Lentibacillus persicus TaxID=640948 RepID=A0A1I1WNG7_9BACI|nr:hypothetical protein [Lentibacillus persicus]SFD96559.1 hypothetical protein SAMN05216238_106187 [Lentibacillus persicus]